MEIVSDASAQVLWTLKKWKMSEDEEDYLEAFNELVRENLVSIFVETLQGSFLPFGSLVFRLLSPKLKLCKLKASLGHLETIDALSPLDLSSSMINGWMLPNGILFLYKRSQCGFQLLAIHRYSQQRFLSSDGHLCQQSMAGQLGFGIICRPSFAGPKHCWY